jgi:catechol 2,3-dioxygenase-like lactoylglutathione lyase family enzyme
LRDRDDSEGSVRIEGENTMSQAELKLNKIGVVMLGVKDKKRALEFYRDTLGLAVQQDIGEFVSFDGGGVTLALSPSLAAHSPALVGATEIVFSVPDVRAAYAALQARGVAFLREPRQASGPMWVANFTDPDGHRLSLFGPEGA